MKPIHFNLDYSPVTVNNISKTKDHVTFNVHWTKDKDNDFNYIIKAEVKAAEKIGEALGCELVINGGTGTEYYRTTSCSIREKEPVVAESITWDWKGQPDVNELNATLKRAGFKGSINAVETNGDQMALVVSPIPLSDKEAQEVYNQQHDDLD